MSKNNESVVLMKNEKEIIRGKRAYKKILKICGIILIGLAIFFAIASRVSYHLAVKVADERSKQVFYNVISDYPGLDKEKEEAISRIRAIPDTHKSDVWRGLSFVFFVLFIIVILCNMYISKMEIVVTNYRVYGKKPFGKRVDLPLNAISAVGTGSLNGIYVGTSAGKIYFIGIENNGEVHKEISKLLNETQNIQTTGSDEIEKIKKYKELLDMKVITQEEFERKKEELLKWWILIFLDLFGID